MNAEKIWEHLCKRPALWIALFATILFGQTLGFEFIQYDDVDFVRAYSLSQLNGRSIIDQLFRPLWPPEISPFSFYYRPLVSLTSMLLTILGDGQPFLFHLFSIFLHGTVCVLLFNFLKRLQVSAGNAFVLSLIFAAHPLCASVVGWVGGYNDSLLALFSILSAICLMNSVSTPGWKWPISHGVCLLAVFCTKESGLLLPLALLILTTAEQRKTQWKIYLSWITAYALYFIARSISISSGPGGEWLDYASTLPALFASLVIGFGKILIPLHPQVMATAQPVDLLLGAISIITLGILSKNAREPWKVFLGITWFVCFYAPTLLHDPNLPLNQFTLREDRLYTAMIGIFIFMSSLRVKISAKYVVPLAILCFAHTRSYSDRQGFWSKAVQDNRLAFSRLHYGDVLTDSGDYAGALKWYEDARALFPKQKLLNNNRGVAFLRMNRYSEAEQAFNEELTYYPNELNALSNLALTKSRQNDPEAAFILYRHILSLFPNHVPSLEGAIETGIAINRQEEVNQYMQRLERTRKL